MLAAPLCRMLARMTVKNGKVTLPSNPTEIVNKRVRAVRGARVSFAQR